MNKLIRISVSVLLSVFILVSGSGLIIGKMVCLKSGYTVLSAKEAKDCCNDDNSCTKVEGACCDITNVIFHQDNFVPQHNLSLSHLFASHAILFSDLISTIYSFPNSKSGNFPIPDPPQLICGSSSLPFLGVFRI